MYGWMFDLYQADTVYVWPGVIAGAQVPLSWVLTSLRSPLVQAVIERFSAWLPVWESVVYVHVYVFVPLPPSSQQVGTLPEACSSEGFLSRLFDWLLT